MSKKILAGVLAAASILSVSAVASAAETSNFTGGANGPSYSITAPVDYGTVDVTVPAKMDGVVVNPYHAAIKTGAANKEVKNKNFVASPVFEIKNNATAAGDAIEVWATTSVTKATGLVVVNADATMPEGWDTATVSATDTTLVHPAGDNWNPLYTYDKITAKTDKTSGVTTYTGGKLSAKQGNNVAINVVGIAGTSSAANAMSETKAADLVDPNTTETLNVVAFHAKGTNTGSLGIADKDESVFYTVCGELSDLAPATDASYAWGKESLSLSVVLKIVPTDPVPVVVSP